MATTNPTCGTGDGEGNGGGRKDEGKKGRVTEKRDYRRGKRHQSYDVSTKEKIVKMLDEGARNCDIVKALNVPESTVRRLRKTKDEVKKQCASARKYFICKPGNSGQGQHAPHRAMREQTERNHLLMITEHYVYQWLSRRLSEGISVDGQRIRETAREYYIGVCQKKNIKHPPQFTASKGWLQRFKKRCALKHAKYQGEISSADKEAAEAYIPVAKQIILDGNYSHHQLFNCDETGIYWRRTPSSTFIPKEIKQAPGKKLAKDKFSVLFTCNASGDCKMKPLVIYKHAKPHSYRNMNMKKLPNCYWLHNSSGYMTQSLSVEWFDKYFVPDAKKYCEDKGIAFKIVLFLDNAPGHAQYLVDRHPAVHVVFLPPNTTSILQPLDQELIANIKLIFYGYLHKKMRLMTDKRTELATIQEQVSSEESTDEPDNTVTAPATPAVTSPTRTLSPQPSTSHATDAVHLRDIEPGSIISIKQFWKHFQIKQAVDLMCLSWKEITTSTIEHAWNSLLPHLKLEREDRQRHADLLRNTIKAVQEVPGMEQADTETVRDMIEDESSKGEKTLAEMMEADEVLVDDGTSATSPNQPQQITTRLLSQVLGICDSTKEEICALVNGNEDLENKTKVYLGQLIDVFQELYQEKLKTSKQAKITKFFQENLERQRNIRNVIASIDLDDDSAEVFSDPPPLEPEIEPEPQPETQPPQPAQPHQPAQPPQPPQPPKPNFDCLFQTDADFRGFDEVETLARQMVARGDMMEEEESDEESGGGH